MTQPCPAEAPLPHPLTVVGLVLISSSGGSHWWEGRNPLLPGGSAEMVFVSENCCSLAKAGGVSVPPFPKYQGDLLALRALTQPYWDQ